MHSYVNQCTSPDTESKYISIDFDFLNVSLDAFLSLRDFDFVSSFFEMLTETSFFQQQIA